MRVKLFFSLLTIGLLISGLSTASSEHPDKVKTNAPILKKTVDGTVLDSMIVALYDDRIFGSFNDYINDFILINEEQLSQEDGQKLDSIYKGRLDLMASAIKLPYNSVVRSYIQSYTKNKHMQLLLGRAMYYMPIFEEELYRQGLPTELKMLPIVESGLNPKAVSKSGATGLWQFMYASGKMYGLKVNSFVDDRMDPLESTKAACKYLKDLYAIYNDWTLVLAAYNCGPGNVNKAIQRAGNSKNYWDIYNYLPNETRGYVPAFIGATYAYTFHKAHDMEVIKPMHPIATDTVHISNKMLHFKQISTTIDVSLETLKALNPRYRIDIIPALDAPAPLILPVSYISKFIEKESEIYAKSDQYLKEFKNSDNLKAAKAGSSGLITHKVKSGEVLGNIAKKYKVTVNNILKWNNLKNPKALRAGQTLKIHK